MIREISRKGKSAPPVSATKRWIVERTNSWDNAHKKLVWCTERLRTVIDFWVAPSEVIIIALGDSCVKADPLPLGGPTFPQTMTY